MDYKHIHNIVYPIGRITPEGVNLLGTCFLINKLDTYVTACHVTNKDSNNLVICLPKVDINGYQDTSDTRVSLHHVQIDKIDPIHDICILKGSMGVQSSLVIEGTDPIIIGQDLTVVGFPHCTHGRNVLTCQDATVGAKILIDNSGIKTKNIVINIQSKPGQSGSPIFSSIDSKLVAMLIGSYAPGGGGGISLGGIDPQTLHQTTHAISAEYINKMI